MSRGADGTEARLVARRTKIHAWRVERSDEEVEEPMAVEGGTSRPPSKAEPRESRTEPRESTNEGWNLANRR